MPDSQSRSESSPEITNSLFNDSEWNELITYLALPERQADILRLLFDGTCDKQIALTLGLSLPTIRTHLQRIYTRFGVTNRTALVVEIFRQFRALDAGLS